MTDFVDGLPRQHRRGKPPKTKAEIREYQKRWHLRNIEKRRAQQKVWGRNSKLRRAHGITLAQYEQILEAQNFCCAVCGLHVSQNAGGRPLHVDHNHITGAMRELLCAGCNLAIGHAREDVSILAKLITYLEKHR